MNERQFQEVSLSAIKPQGWLRRMLELQLHGLTGHLEAAGYPYDTLMWKADPINPDQLIPWWPYEQTAYWLDGMIRCGILIDDPFLINKAKEQFEYTLAHADADGYLGPQCMKAPMPAGRWPHSIYYRGFIALYYGTGDERIISALSRHYLSRSSDHHFHRDVCNIEIMCWLYGKTGNNELLQMAEETWREFQANAVDDDLQLVTKTLMKDEPASAHGVTFIETLKLPAILYYYTGEKSYLTEALAGYKKLDKYSMIISGVPSSSEQIKSNTAMDVHETCDIVDYMWCTGHFLLATGDALLGDRIERACFNAFPGAITKDFRQLQYFSGPNQVVLGPTSSHAYGAAGGTSMCYRPKPHTECCTGQVNRILPAYASRMWMLKGSEPAAVLYGASTFTFDIEGSEVSITEETSYPFSEQIDFIIQPRRETLFTLWLRIPGWCASASITKNGKPLKIKCKPGTFTALKDTFAPNDRIVLHLPMELKATQWPKGGIAVERGPVVYALPVIERREIDKKDKNQTKEFPAYNMYPESPFNYALAIEPDIISEHVQIEHCPLSSEPWSNPPVKIHVPARKVRGWKLSHVNKLNTKGGELIDAKLNKWRLFDTTIKGDFLLTPDLPDPAKLPKMLNEKIETITLVPYGCTLLRIAIFPLAKPFRR